MLLLIVLGFALAAQITLLSLLYILIAMTGVFLTEAVVYLYFENMSPSMAWLYKEVLIEFPTAYLNGYEKAF